MATFGGDEVGSLVIDIGTSVCKGGYSGEDTPKAVFPTDYGLLVPPESNGDIPMAEESSSSSSTSTSTVNKKDLKRFIGDSEVIGPRANMEIKNPMSGGLVSDWEAMEHLWDFMFNNKLRVNIQEHPVLLSEPSFNTKEIREKMTEIFFEKYQVPGLYFCKDAVLSAFSAGKSTALVLDSGAEVTRAVPVIDGYVLKKNLIKQQFAGSDVTQEVISYLESKMNIELIPYYRIKEKHAVDLNQPHKAVFRQLPFQTTNSFDNYMKTRLANEFKESICQISEGRFSEAHLARQPVKLFEFPTGYNTNFGVDRFRLPEILFNPTFVSQKPAPTGMEVDEAGEQAKPPAPKHVPLHKMVTEAISKCDPDLRATLFQNILITGGNTMFPNFGDRLMNEITAGQTSYKVKITAPVNAVERRFSSWIGGSILTSLGSFHQMWISKAEYEETGRIIVEKKCP